MYSSSSPKYVAAVEQGHHFYAYIFDFYSVISHFFAGFLYAQVIS